jgi:hypothetical protein
VTAYRFVTITCDSCGEISDGGSDTSVKEARATARSAGWRYLDRLDWCPAHFGFIRLGEFGWVHRPDLADSREQYRKEPV